MITVYCDNDCLLRYIIDYVESLNARLRPLSLLDPVSLMSSLEVVDAAIHGDIESMLNRVQIEFQNFSRSPLDDFLYLLSAWTDEALVEVSRGKFALPKHASLEWQRFGTMDAGERLFEKIEQSIARHDEADRYMLPAYLYVLLLGFKGQFEQIRGVSPLVVFKEKILALSSRDTAIDHLWNLPKSNGGISLLAVRWRLRLIIAREWLLACSIIIWIFAFIFANAYWHFENSKWDSDNVPVKTTTAKVDTPTDL